MKQKFLVEIESYDLRSHWTEEEVKNCLDAGNGGEEFKIISVKEIK